MFKKLIHVKKYVLATALFGVMLVLAGCGPVNNNAAGDQKIQEEDFIQFSWITNNITNTYRETLVSGGSSMFYTHGDHNEIDLQLTNKSGTYVYAFPYDVYVNTIEYPAAGISLDPKEGNFQFVITCSGSTISGEFWGTVTKNGTSEYVITNGYFIIHNFK